MRGQSRGGPSGLRWRGHAVGGARGPKGVGPCPRSVEGSFQPSALGQPLTLWAPSGGSWFLPLAELLTCGHFSF